MKVSEGTVTSVTVRTAFEMTNCHSYAGHNLLPWWCDTCWVPCWCITAEVVCVHLLCVRLALVSWHCWRLSILTLQLHIKLVHWLCLALLCG